MKFIGFKVGPVLAPKWKWNLMKLAKRTGGWDTWLGKKFGWDFDEDEEGMGGGFHWHFENAPFIVYRYEY